MLLLLTIVDKTSIIIAEIRKKEKTMADYKKMYLQMYNAITDAIEILKEAQIKAEEEFIESEDKPIELSEFLNKKK